MHCNILETVEKEKIIVIVRGVEKEKILPLAEAMYSGGIRLLEITYGRGNAETAENIKMLKKSKLKKFKI